mgnify:CR=1 FL=1
MINYAEVTNSLLNSNVLFYIIVFVLVFLSITMFYLIYSENKSAREKRKALAKAREANIPLIKTVEDEEDSNDAEELKSITQELANIPREKNIKLTPYEEEQEEKAIISYDELLSKTNEVSIEYSDTVVEDDVSVKKVDLEKTGKIELDPIKRELNSRVNILGYEHEEDFLSALKQLRSMLD